METVSLTSAVVGLVELINRLYDKDYRAASKIATALVVGALIGPVVGVTWLAGLVLGLGASGVITAVSKVGK